MAARRRRSDSTKEQAEVEDDEQADVGLQRVVAARAQVDRGGAHQAEDRARGADRERVGLDREGAEGAPQQRREVEGDEPRRAQHRLEHPPEDPQQVHVEGDVEQAGVQEAAGDQPPPVARRDVGAVEREVRGRARCRPREVPAPRFPVARKARTHTAMIAIVARGSVDVVGQRRASSSVCREHSGQRMPTGVGVMQSGQIGRPQDEQLTARLARRVAVAGLRRGLGGGAHAQLRSTVAVGPPTIGGSRGWSPGGAGGR